MKKLLSLLFCFNIAFSAMAYSDTWTTSGNYDGVGYTGGDGSLSTPYLISTPQQLARLAYLASSADITGYYKLTTDIDLSGHDWTPIGNYNGTTGYKFTGVFDGDNHTINNIYINNSSSGNPQGLFGWVQGTSSTNLSAIIQNITMGSGSVTTTYTTGATYTASLVGRGQYIQLINCKNTINVTGYTNAGGIAGRVDGVSTIDGCSNLGTIKSTQNTSPYTGGIVGLFTGSTSSGASNTSYIRTCYNRGAVSTPNYGGGIVGQASGNISIDKCFNTGTINGSTNGASGGIVGYGFNTGTNFVAALNISNCYNTGTIKAQAGAITSNSAGGILGFIGTANEGRNFGSITNCYNIGTITGYISEPIAAALVFSGTSNPTPGTVTNTYFLTNSGINNIVNNGASTAAATLQGYASTLNNPQSPTVWQADLSTNINGGYPILSWIAGYAKLTAPTVQTPTGITTTGFTANWTAVPNAIGYYVNVYNNATPVTYKTSQYAAGQVTTSTTFASGLTNNSSYIYKVIAVAPSGTTYMDSEESGSAIAGIGGPSVLLSSYSEALSTSVTVNCSVTDGAGAGVTARGICYSTITANPLTTDSKIVDSGTGNGSYSLTMSGLTANTTYYFRAYATNSTRTNYSLVSSFRILSTPATPTAATNITSAGITANWTAVASASSYDVKVYQGATLISTTNASGQATNSKAISGLSPNTSYTYTITAKGDGVSTLNSAESTASASFTTHLIPTVTVTVGTYTYNGSAQGPNIATNTGTGSSYTFSYSGSGSTSYVPSSTQPSSTGTYTVTATVAANGNYDQASSAATAFSILSTGAINADTNVSSLTLATASNLSVSAGYTLTIDAATTVNSVTIAPGAKLTLTAAQTLTTGSISLQSSSSGTATFVDNTTNGGLIVTGSATVQQYLPTARNWYMSSPVSGTNLSLPTVDSGTLTFYSYPENDGGQAAGANGYAAGAVWTTVNSGSMATGNGYIVKPGNAATTLSFSGTGLNSGDITISGLTYTSANPKHGFNLIGNPYPSYLNVLSSITANSNLEATAWYRTRENSGSYLYHCETVNAASGVGTDNAGTGRVTGYIPPMQAFWVRLKTNNQSIILHQASRSHAKSDVLMAGYSNTPTTALKSPALKSQQYTLLGLRVSNGISSDETIVMFSPDASNELDAYDSGKMSNGSALIPEIYTLLDGQQIAINGMKTIPYDTEIALGFTTGTAGTFSIKASQIANFETGTQLILKDYQDSNNPVITDLSDGNSYSFSSAVTTNNSSRFSLIFKAPSSATGISPAEKSDIWISSQNGRIMINGVSGDGARLEVYNAIGQKVFSENLTRFNAQLNSKFVAGTYLVKLSSDGYTQTKKVIID